MSLSQPKVIGPAVSAGMIQWGELAGLGIERGDVGALVLVAQRAGQGEVVGLGFATVFLRNDVIRSASCATKAAISGVRQYSHWPWARSATSRRNRAVMEARLMPI